MWMLFCHDEGIKPFHCCALFFLSPYPPYSLENESDPQENQATHKEVFTRETPLGFKVTTVITYKDVQPPITRLLRRLTSFFGSNDSPPSENWVLRKLRTLCWSWLVWESHPGAWHKTVGGKLSLALLKRQLHLWNNFVKLANLLVCSDHCCSLHVYSNY